MLTYHEFVATVRAAVPRLQQNWLNAEQELVVRAAPHPPTFIVAGPGAGKTIVLVLRVLKLILVDQLVPSSVITTTFTRKAAGQLRSRILSWGYATVNLAIQNAHQAGDPQRVQWLRDIDVNAIRVGTLDSLAEEFLIECRTPGQITPTTIETFLARGLMRRQGFFVQMRYRDPQLTTHLNAMKPHFPYANAFADKLTVALAFAERVRHDAITLSTYAQGGPGNQLLCDVISDYLTALQDNHLADYARLEYLLLDMILNGQLATITGGLSALLVDEFQDTNYLQEQIYLELCRLSNASLTLVGDDDQSIYRFRGASVEIFANFQTRIVQSLGQVWQPNRVDLYRNYRSTRCVVDFCQAFIQQDPTYQPARVPGKIPLVAGAPHAAIPLENLPVFGMFRSDCQTLARDLAQLLIDVFRGHGRQIQCAGVTYNIQRSLNGDFGDSVLLARSVRERSTSDPPRDRLPLLLRQRLEAPPHNVRVFNPRGRSLGNIPPVQELLGLALECIDPNGTVLNSIPQTSMAQNVRNRLNGWRQTGLNFAATNPPPGGLNNFLHGWQTHTAASMPQWPRDWPLLELIFTLTTWFPFLQTDPEGQVYLEAVMRTIAEVGQMATYAARIIHGMPPHNQNSVRQAIREVFEPIATESIDIDEDIMPHVPRNYFPMMTIHQAKGLEFPLVIVDVGSDFRSNHHAQARFRYPSSGDDVHAMEDMVEQHCPIGPLRTSRPPVDRAWDDLRRLYFVAYSRPENVLILAGLTSQIRQSTPVQCIAVGDLQNSPRGITFVPANQWSPGLGPGSVALI